jgi:hypothetical protein
MSICEAKTESKNIINEEQKKKSISSTANTADITQTNSGEKFQHSCLICRSLINHALIFNEDFNLENVNKNYYL